MKLWRTKQDRKAMQFVIDMLADAPKPGDIVPATGTRPPFRYLGDGKWERLGEEK